MNAVNAVNAVVFYYPYTRTPSVVIQIHVFGCV